MLAKEWSRKSRICSVSQLQPELIQAVRRKADDAELGRVEADVLFCVETESEKIKKNIFSSLAGFKDKVIYNAALVTPDWFIMAYYGEKTGGFATFYYYEKMEVNSLRPGMIDDCGLEIIAQGHGVLQRGMFFVGLENQLIANQLKEELRAAIAKVG